MKKLVGLLVLLVVVAGCGTVTPTPVDTTATTPIDNTPVVDNNSNPPSDTQTPPASPTTPTTPPTGNVKSYTMADVQAAKTRENCLSVINGKVYNLTAWIDKHPGGDMNILKICGMDGSSAFTRKHGGQPRPEQILAGFEVGVLK